jgi:hypothetical protein
MQSNKVLVGKKNSSKTSSDINDDNNLNNNEKLDPGRLLRPRVLCLHGFRSSGDIFQIALAPLFNTMAALNQSNLASGLSVDDVDFVFLNAPHLSSGPAEAAISPEIQTYEWWAGEVKTLDLGWRSFGDGTAYIESLHSVLDYIDVNIPNGGPIIGIIGFSQGAALAVALTSSSKTHSHFPHLQFVACFSAVPPRKCAPPFIPSADISKRQGVLAMETDSKKAFSEGEMADPVLSPLSVPSFHCFDTREEHWELCTETVAYFSGPVTAVHHSAGHAIPRSNPDLHAIAQEFEMFLASL